MYVLVVWKFVSWPVPQKIVKGAGEPLLVAVSTSMTLPFVGMFPPARLESGVITSLVDVLMLPVEAELSITATIAPVEFTIHIETVRVPDDVVECAQRSSTQLPL